MTGAGAGVIAHASDFSLVTLAHPALPGEYLAIFCTGLGAAQTPVPSGAAASASDPVTAAPVVVLSSNYWSYNVQYAGLAPGWPGLYQVNVQVPANETAGAKSLTVTIGSYFQSNTVTLYVE